MDMSLTIGILLSNACLAYALIATLHTGLLAHRARLEENMLAANDPVYKKHATVPVLVSKAVSAYRVITLPFAWWATSHG